MKILLVDVDSKIPNLALMKISSYHKSVGNVVDFIRLGFSGYPRKYTSKKIIKAHDYDEVYVSVIFTVNKDRFRVVGCDNVLIGGTGHSLSVSLSQEIDDQQEDYSIYPENNYSYGFITRGCIRNCYFCFVPTKEGKLYKYRDWKSIVKHEKTFFLDNNFLAYDKHKDVLYELNENHIRFQFNQGLDIRLIDDENAKLLSQSHYIGEFIFAFDDVRYERLIDRGLSIFRKYYPPIYREKFFIYCHPNHSLSDVLYRVSWCKNNKVLPYIMRDASCWDSPNNSFYVDLASYCNQPQFFKNRSFLKYLNDRYPSNKTRVQNSYSLVESCNSHLTLI